MYGDVRTLSKEDIQVKNFCRIPTLGNSLNPFFKG